MRSYNSNRSSRGRDDRDRGRPDMHKATCEDCGRRCEVPFKPSGGKPVYCSDCFRKDDSPRNHERRDDRGRGRDRDRDRGRDRGRPDMHKATCEDCGRRCEVPFKPSGGKPVYCSNCFEKGTKSGSNRPDQSSKKHDEINVKLDKIIFLLQQMTQGKEETAVKSKKLIKALKVVKKKVVKKAASAKKVTVKKVVKKKATKKASKK